MKGFAHTTTDTEPVPVPREGAAEEPETVTEPETVDGEPDAVDGEPEAREGTRRLRHRLRQRLGPGLRPVLRAPGRRAAVAVAAVVLLLAGAGLLFGARQLTGAPAAANHALTDTEATSQVAGDVSGTLAKVFSYTPDGTAATERSARELLDGKAARQYEELFGQVRTQVAEQKVTLSTRVVRAGVVRLTDDSAELLVFLDQTTRRGDRHPTSAAAQLSVTAQLREGQWRIVDIKAR